MSVCEKINQMFSEYIDHVLGEKDTRDLESHLATCPKCRADLQKMMDMIEAMRAVKPVEPPADFVQQVNVRIKQNQSLDSFLTALLKKPQVLVPVTVAFVAVFSFTMLRIVPPNRPVTKVVGSRDWGIEAKSRSSIVNEKVMADREYVTLQSGRLAEAEPAAEGSLQMAVAPESKRFSENKGDVYHDSFEYTGFDSVNPVLAGGETADMITSDVSASAAAGYRAEVRAGEFERDGVLGSSSVAKQDLGYWAQGKEKAAKLSPAPMISSALKDSYGVVAIPKKETAQEQAFNVVDIYSSDQSQALDKLKVYAAADPDISLVVIDADRSANPYRVLITCPAQKSAKLQQDLSGLGFDSVNVEGGYLDAGQQNNLAVSVRIFNSGESNSSAQPGVRE